MVDGKVYCGASCERGGKSQFDRLWRALIDGNAATQTATENYRDNVRNNSRSTRWRS